MIYKEQYVGNIYSPTAIGENTYYYCEDVKNIPGEELRDDWRRDVESYMYKQCITPEGEEGIIIGFEINNQYLDYYYRVYIPNTNKVKSILANDASFTKTIK